MKKIHKNMYNIHICNTFAIFTLYILCYTAKNKNTLYRYSVFFHRLTISQTFAYCSRPS